MATLLPAPNPQSMDAGTNGLKIAMTVFAAFGFAFWGTSTGFLLGWDYTYYGVSMVSVAMYLTIFANIAMIYVAARLIFIVMNPGFPYSPSSAQQQGLRENVARMVAFTVVGFTTWVTSVVWLGLYSTDHDIFVVYHACNYGFIFGILVSGLAGGILRKVSSHYSLRTPAPKYNAPAHTEGPPTAQHAHYNPAYSHYGGQRTMYN